jgi:heptosyltransferase I
MTDIRLDRVAIVMMSAVGDAVHVLPVINAIKRAKPSSRISWIMQPGPAGLVRGHESVDEILLFDRTKGPRAYLDLRHELAHRHFDVALALQVYFKAGLVAAITPADVKLGFDRARARDLNWLFTNRRIEPHPMQHVQDQYLEFLRPLGVPAEPLQWRLGPWAEERPWQREFFAPFERPAVSIVVATSKAEKDWMPERWATVCDTLWHDFGLQPVLVGGRSSRELAAEEIIMRTARCKPVSALGSGLRKLVSIIDGSALVLSPDTGPLHITVALDRPVVSLIAYSNPKRVGPYRKFRDLMIDAYGDPGEEYPVTMENRPGRMPRITVPDVLDRVERWRTTYAPRYGMGAVSTSRPNS